jgi:hypothetical protein
LIEAASAEVLALLHDWIAIEPLTLFSDLLRKDLRKLLGSAEAVQLIEACCTIGNYGDAADHVAFDRAVARLLKRRQVRLPKGKRAHPALVRFVDGVAPILVACGVQPASGDNARMVVVLREIAAALDIQGDPRDVLRSLARKHKARLDFVRWLVSDIIAKALAPDQSEPK